MDDLDLELDRKKRYLKRYKKNLALIRRLKNKIANLESRIESLNSPTLSDMPKGGIPVTKEDLVDDKLETLDRIKRLTARGKRLKADILEKIDELEDIRYAEIAESFFIECMSFEEIASSMDYSTRHVIHLYNEAVNAIEIE